MYPTTLNKIYKGRGGELDFQTLARIVVGLKRLGVSVNVGDLLEVVEDETSLELVAARQGALTSIQGHPGHRTVGFAEPVPFRGPASEDLLKLERAPESWSRRPRCIWTFRPRSACITPRPDEHRS